MRPKLAVLLVFAVAAFSPLLSVAQTRASKTLDIYVIDVEGGNATLFVAPSGESMLMDTGYPGEAAKRDAGRIVDALHDAGLQQIDHLITTHWHGDHFGGLAELASRVTVREFIDHGLPENEPNMSANTATAAFLRDVYPELYAKAKHTVVKPGDRIAIRGIDVRVVSSAGKTIEAPLPGGGKKNPYCDSAPPADSVTPSPFPEDAQSVGVFVTFGKFRTVHLGDLTKSKEFQLMCPVNRLGTADVLLGLHHGQATSNSMALIHALRPRVAIMNNGTRKGGEPEVMKVIHSSPDLEDLWQMHFSLLSGQEYTVPGMFIANTLDDPITAMPIAPMVSPPGGTAGAPVHNGKAYWIKVSAQPDGTFTVTNQRNQFSKTYAARSIREGN
jgi:beta-lactamase superfamily II metal-dependent hydrolase